MRYGFHTAVNGPRDPRLAHKFASKQVVDLAEMGQRLLVISPVRNEAPHLERVARAMAAQTRPPDLWLLVDDHSTDETYEIAARLAAEIPFISVLSAPAAPLPDPGDRLASAAAPRTFNFGLQSVERRRFSHIAKLDGDIELPPRYFESILAEFEADRRLGMAGGLRTELVHGRRRLERVPTEHHVNGALKCYSRACFESIGGVQERLGWDTIDETLARMRGYRTRTFEGLVAIHHRPWASADGTLRGRARYGAAAYVVHFPAYWVALRSLKIATARPQVISGLAFLYGYARAALRRTPRVEDREFRRTIQRETRGRLFGKLPLASRA